VATSQGNNSHGIAGLRSKIFSTNSCFSNHYADGRSLSRLAPQIFFRELLFMHHRIHRKPIRLAPDIEEASST
jgi:hypothetical protein